MLLKDTNVDALHDVIIGHRLVDSISSVSPITENANDVIDSWVSEIKDISKGLLQANKRLDFVALPWKAISSKCIAGQNLKFCSDQGTQSEHFYFIFSLTSFSNMKYCRTSKC
jgi:hypothetical protein